MTDTPLDTAAKILNADPATIVKVVITADGAETHLTTGTVITIPTDRWTGPSPATAASAVATAAASQPDDDVDDDAKTAALEAAGVDGPLPGGMYEFPDGTRVRGRDDAYDHLLTLADSSDSAGPTDGAPDDDD